MNNSKMFLVTIFSITTVLLASSAFSPLANAQYQYQDQSQGPQGGPGQGPPRDDNQGQGQSQGYPGYQGQGGQGFKGQHQFQGTRTAVSGTYTDSNYGVSVTLPDGWSGFEMKQQSGNARVNIAPGGITQGDHPAVTIGISIMPSGPVHKMMPKNMQGATCTNSTETNTISSVIFNAVTISCTGTDQDGNPIEMKSKMETGTANNANIVFGLRASSASDFDSNVAAFDKMVGTLQISTPTSTTTTSADSNSIPTPGNTNPNPNPTPIPTPPIGPTSIPKWVKGIFGMYAQGQLSDNDLVQALQFLIKQGIIKVQ